MRPSFIFDYPLELEWTDKDYLGSSISGSPCWKQQWGQIFLIQPISVPCMQPNPWLSLVGTRHLAWFWSSSYSQRLENYLEPCGKTPLTCPRRLEPSFHFLACVCVIANGSWFDLKERRLQTEFGLIWWPHRWQSDLCIIDRSYKTPCGTYCGRRPGS